MPRRIALSSDRRRIRPPGMIWRPMWPMKSLFAGFTPDADFPAIYCEKGILRLHLTMPLTDSGILDAKGGTVVNMVPDACTVTKAAGTYIGGGEENVYGSTRSEAEAAHGQLPAESGPFAAALYRRCFIHLQSYFCIVYNNCHC